MASRHPLDFFLHPRSIAVIGASTAPHKAGGRRWRSQVEAGFRGALYPVHPTAAEILGRRAYRSMRDVPERVDLAVVLVRPALVPEVIRDCAALRVPAVNVITAGFGEASPEGRRAEEDVVRIVRGGGGRLLGPNSAGLFGAAGRVNLLGWHPPVGPIAVISQSGNMGLALAQRARETALGFSQMLTIGNSADLRLAECVEYLFEDPDTRVIAVYLEGLRSMEGRELYDLVRAHPASKPVVVFKTGGTEAGRRAALSHTGALAGNDRVAAAAFRQCGVVRVTDSDEIWDAAVALALLPPMSGAAAGVVSDGGGHAAIACDAAARLGLAVPSLSDATRRVLAGVLPGRSAAGNPVDFAGVAEEEPEVIARVLDACLSDAAVDGVMFCGHFGGYVKITSDDLGRREVSAAREIAAVAKRRAKPLVVHTIYGDQPLPALAVLREAGIPVYRSPERAAGALAAVWRRSGAGRRGAAPCRRSRPDEGRVAALLGSWLSGGARVVLEPGTRALLAEYGVPVPAFRVARTADEAAWAAEAFGADVAVKLVARGAAHKTDVGGVLLDVAGAAAARAAHRTLMERAAAIGAPDAEVLVTPMIRGGVETVCGGYRDPQFGPVVMFGLGGTLVETLGDVSFRLAPIDEADAKAMIEEVRGAALLRGARGRPPADLGAAIDLLIRVAELMADRPEVAEIDLNPVFLLPDGAALADARAVLADARVA